MAFTLGVKEKPLSVSAMALPISSLCQSLAFVSLGLFFFLYYQCFLNFVTEIFLSLSKSSVIQEK